MKRLNRKLTKEDWLMIAKEYGTVGATDLANRLNVSKQRVQQIVIYLRKQGIEIGTFRNKQKDVQEIVEFIKKELKED